MGYTPVIPPLPSPEGGQSSPAPNPPVIPSFSPQSPPQNPAWMRGPTAQQQNFAAAFPPGMYQQTPYLAMPTLPGHATPNSYYLAPTQLPPAGHGAPHGTPMAPVGPSGFSADWTGFPITATVPPTHGTPWQPAGHTFPGQTQQQAFSAQQQAFSAQQQAFPAHAPQQAPPGTGYNMFQQPLPMGAFLHPGYAAMMQTPFMNATAMPAGWPGGGMSGVQAGYPGMPAGFPGAPGPQAPAQSHTMPPSRVAESFDKFDKFAEENWCTCSFFRSAL